MSFLGMPLLKKVLRMGTGEAGAPMKAAKTLAAQDQQTAPTSYPEWAAAFQAYYSSGGQPPSGYFSPSVVSGPQNPYLWGGQPMMPPYGTPPPYAAVYSHGGMYPHPSIPPVAHPYSQFGLPSQGGASDSAMMTPTGGEMDVSRRIDRVKDRSALKPSKGNVGSPGTLTGRGGDSGKGNPANGMFSQSSGESGSDGSSEGSEENNSQNMPLKGSFDQISVDGAGIAGGNGMALFNLQTGGVYGTPGSGAPVGEALAGAELSTSGKVSSVGDPTTNLGIGIQDYWSGSNPRPGTGGKAVKRTSACASTGMVTSISTTPLLGVGGRDVVQPELWLQDEREVKRQRRKQSNRESARRSRLRKQAECEELGTRVDTLTMENMALRAELARLSEDCKKLRSDHSSLLEQLRKDRVGETILETKQGGEVEHQELVMEPTKAGKADEECKISSPRKQEKSRGGDSSCDPDRPSAFDDVVHAESIGAG